MIASFATLKFLIAMKPTRAPRVKRLISAPLDRSLSSKFTCLLVCLSMPMAGLAATKSASPNTTLALHQNGQYAQAAARGLRDLLAQPWNHELRLLVADSLQRAGKLDEAAVQLEALDGTVKADTAKLRLVALRKLAPPAPVSPTPTVSLAVTPAAGSAVKSTTVAPQISSPVPVVPAATPALVNAIQTSAIAAASPEPIVAAISSPASTNKSVSAIAPALTSAELSSSALDRVIIPPSGETIQLAPFQYIPPAGARPVDAADEPKRSPEHQRLVDLNAAGDYQTLGTEGLALKLDHQLTLMVANSLAWTGRLKQASQTYQGLTQGKYALEARMGLAAIDRWQGRDHLAAPVYRAVLAADPANVDAVEGLKLAERELRPRTLFSMGGSNDSSDIQRRSATINHRWRDAGGANIWEVEASAVKDSLQPLQASQQDLTVRYKTLDRAFKPRLELSTEGSALFGNVGVAVGELPLLVDVGRVNWGRMASNPRGLSAHLAASRVGLQASDTFSFGSLNGRADYYKVSDGNTVLTSSLRFFPAWRPLGSRIKPLMGVETRDSKFNTNKYWSPAQGHGSAYAGLQGEWGSADWDLFASGQVGAPLYGEAGKNWSLSAGGKRWLSNDWAIGVNFWAMSSLRDNTPYRSQSLSINIERLWK